MKTQNHKLLNRALLAITLASSTNVLASPADLIESISSSGTGCQADSADAQVVFGSYLLIEMPDLKAAKGPGIPLRDKRKFCQVTVNFSSSEKVELGFQLVALRGAADVSEGASAKMDSSAYVSGINDDIESSLVETLVEGPANEEFIHKASKMTWLGCKAGHSINLKTSVAILGFGATEGTLI